jgi:hypothetical protein
MPKITTDSRSAAGQSLYEMMWERLDAYVDALKTGQAEEGDNIRAEELCHILAIFTNPYAPNFMEVRRESTRRWKARKDSVRTAA